MHLLATHFGTYEVARDAAGRPVLKPFRRDPDPSPVGAAYLDLADHKQRLRGPMARRSWLESAPGAGGGPRRPDDQFVPIDWKTAARLAAREIERVRAQHGNEAIFAGSYGWASAGRFHHAQSQLKRFLALAGGFTTSVNTYSYGAAGVLLPHLLGPDHRDACDTAPSWDSIARNCRLLVGFGGFRGSNAQVEAGGTGAHLATAWLAQAQGRGMRVVVFSPAAADAPPGPDVRHIPLRPNTDAAVMLAMAHVLITENRIDCDFLARCTIGADIFAASLTGSSPKTPEWAEAISGVPAATIRELAHDLASQPSLINVAWSLQRGRFGEQPFWAAIALACLAGHVGMPGCGFAFGLTAVNSVGQPVRRLKGPAFPQPLNPVKAFIPVARITELLETPGGRLDYDGRVLPLPNSRLLWWAGGNPFHHHQDLNRLARAFARPETIIVQETMWTATARHADLVLPARFPFERDDVAASSRDNWIIASRTVLPPPRDVIGDHAALTLIAAELGLRDAFTEGRDEAAWIRHLYDGYQTLYPELPDFDAFWERGYAALDEGEAAPNPADHFQAFVADPARHPLGTKSGRIELACATIAGFGYEDCPGYPTWLAPEEFLGAELADRYPIHLLSPQPATRLHSQLDHAGPSQHAKHCGYEQVALSRADAAANGVGQGDIVELFNDRGRALASATIDAGLSPGVAVLPTGAWHDPDGSDLDRGGNPNTLTSTRPTSTLSQAPAPNSCLIAIRRRPDLQPSGSTK